MKRTYLAIAAGLTLAFATPAAADRQVASIYVPDAELTGTARLSVLGFKVFDAELFAPSGRYDPASPYALTIRYLRNFSGESIVERSIDEMRKQGLSDPSRLAAWQAQMNRIFPDVTDETYITGVRDENGHARFFRNGAEIGTIADREFSDRFFAIWLGEETSNASLRRKLIGAGR